MLRRFTSTASCAASASFPCALFALSTSSSSAVTDCCRFFSSRSNGLDRRKAREFVKNSVLMSAGQRGEIEALVARNKANVVLDLQEAEEESDDAPGKQTAGRETAGAATKTIRGAAAAAAAGSDGDKKQQQQPRIPPASAWWADACVLRRNRESRHNAKAAVVGGEANIRRIWHKLGVKPRCIFVPDNMGSALPEWMMSPASRQSSSNNKDGGNTVIVRAPAARINRELLSAERNDGFAAEFPLPARVPREVALFSPEEQMEQQQQAQAATATQGGASPSPVSPILKLSRVVVAHGLRVPGNVGSIIKNARSAGFDAVILDRCCELTSEKVLRAAGDAAFDPAFHILEFGQKLLGGSTRLDGQRDNATTWAEGVNSALLLKRIAAAHGLLPMMLVPQTIHSSVETGDSYDVFAVAQQFHYSLFKEMQQQSSSAGADRRNNKQLGAMIVVGGEAAGLSGLASDWNRDALYVPMLPVAVRMDNPQVNSINVAAAASVAMHLFRPRAAGEFEEYFRRGITPPQNESEASTDSMKDLLPLQFDSRDLLGQLRDASKESAAGLLSK